MAHNSASFMTRQPHTATGFSLLEVLIALIVLGMGLISLARFQVTVMQDNSLSHERTTAIHLAEQQLDLLRTYASVATAPGVTPPPSFEAITGGSGTVSSGNVIYTRSWAVENRYYGLSSNSGSFPTAPIGSGVLAPPYPNFKIILVSVTWPDRDGNPLPPPCSFGTALASAETRVCLMTTISASDPSR